MAPKKVAKAVLKKPSMSPGSDDGKHAKRKSSGLTAEKLSAHEELLKQKFKSKEEVISYVRSLEKSDQEQIWKAKPSCV